MTDEQPPAKPLSVVDRLLSTRPLAELLALDWTQTDRVVGMILGVSVANAWRLRHRLHEQGHPIPIAKRGPRQGTRSESDTVASAPDRPTRSRGPWRCPVCPFAAEAPAALADHLRLVHMPPLPEQEAAKFWKCPWSKCRRHRRTLHGAFSLALHLDAHVAMAAMAVIDEESARRSMVGKLLATHSREEPLSIDWSQTHGAIAAAFGISSFQAADLRRRLRDEGLPVPKARRGVPPGRHPARDKYIAAGIGKIPDRQVAEALGVSRSAVHQVRQALQLPPGPRMQRKKRTASRRQTTRRKEGAIAKRTGRTCPRCREKPLPMKGLSPVSGKPRYRSLCDACARRRRRAKGLPDPAPPLCPRCGTRPRWRKGFRHGYPRYEPFCGPCGRVERERQGK